MGKTSTTALKLNPDQAAVVEAKKGNILVSAAAGSGKTAVLKERILSRIKSGDLSLQGLLLITFTNNTAAELRQKVLESLQKAVLDARGIEKERLEEAIYQVPFAQISTIHAFCLSVIKDFQHLLPEFKNESGEVLALKKSLRTLSEEQSNFLFEQALEESLKRFYETYPEPLEKDEEEAKAFYALVDAYGAQLKESLSINYQKLRSLGQYQEALDEFLERYEAFVNQGRDDLALGEALVNESAVYRHFVERFFVLREAYHQQLEKISKLLDNEDLLLLKDVKKNKLRIEELKNFTELGRVILKEEVELQVQKALNEQVLELSTFQSLIEQFALLKEELPSEVPSIVVKKTDEQAEEKRALQALLKSSELLEFRSLFGLKVSQDQQKKFLYPYCPFLSQSFELYLEEKRKALPLLKVYKKLLDYLDFKFTELKRNQYGIDFEDYEHLALSLLQQEEVQAYYKQHFQEIYVDEYQDTSAIQERILECISRDNLFTVGDIKQSIYRFRKAKPKNFLNRMAIYEADEMNGRLLRINENFRSQENIVLGVNQIFEAIMQEDFSEIRYDDSHSLKAFVKNSKVNKPRANNLNLWLFNKSEDTAGASSEEEALSEEKEDQVRLAKDEMKREAVLEEIRRLRKEGVSYSDIAILAPKHKFLDAFIPFFEAEGIPHAKPKDVHFFKQFFTLQFEAFLEILENPYQDYPLSVLLYGSLFTEAFSIKELALVAYVAKLWRLPFHKSLEKLSAFFKKEHSNDEPVLVLQKTLCEVSEWSLERLQAWVLKVQDFQEKMEVYRFLSKETDLLSLFEYVLKQEEILERTKMIAKQEATLLTEEIFEFRRWLSSLDVSNVRVADLLALIKDGKKQEKNIKLSPSQKAEAIHLETFHGSKGLQYKYVFLLGLDASLSKSLMKEKKEVFVLEDRFGFYPILSKKEKKFSAYPELFDLHYAYYEASLHREAKAEFQRLLYVALTRAEEYLYILGDASLAEEDLEQSREELATGTALSFGTLGKAKSLFEWIQQALSPMLLSQVNRGAKGAEWTLRTFEESDFIVETEEEKELVEEQKTLLLPIYEALSQHEKNFREVQGDLAQGLERKQSQSVLPTKTSVSSLKRLQQETEWDSVEVPEDISLASLSVTREKVEVLQKSLEVEDSHYTGAKLGSLYHRYFELLPLSFEVETVEKRLELLKEQALIQEEEYESLLTHQQDLLAFEQSFVYPLMKEAKQKKQLFREMPFTISTEVKVDGAQGKTEKVLVQGRIDLWFIHQGQVYLLDYKSDRLVENGKVLHQEDEVLNFLQKRYAFQLSCYAKALRKTVKKKIDFVYVYHIPSQKLYALSVEEEEI